MTITCLIEGITLLIVMMTYEITSSGLVGLGLDLGLSYTRKIIGSMFDRVLFN